jgi:hypothetical protein
LPVSVSESEHLGVHVHTDDPALRTHDLAGDETDLPCPGPQIQHGFPLPEEPARVATAVVLQKNLLRHDREVLFVVVDRAAEFGFPPQRPATVAVGHSPFDIEG